MRCLLRRVNREGRVIVNLIRALYKPGGVDFAQQIEVQPFHDPT
jgi:hypothetical protein